MAKVLYATDIHLKDTPPISRTDDYAEALFEKLEKIRKICVKLEAEAFIMGGDVFDVKDSKKVSHYLVRRCLEVFREFPCPVYSIVGNHDIKYDRLDTVYEQPLGVLFESGLVKRLSRIEVGSCEFIGVDYTSHNKTDVSSFTFDKGAGRQVLVTHHNLFINKTDFFGEKAIPYSVLAEETNADAVLNGHIHFPQDGQYIVEIGGKFFINPGALSRGSLSRDNLERPVHALLIDTEEFSFNLIDLKAKPVNEIFDLESKSEIDERSKKIEEFVLNLKTSVQEEAGDNITDILESLDIPSNIRKKVEHYLSIAGED